MKLLWELEYEVNELRKRQLDVVRYEELTIKELLDLGFNNTYTKINDAWYQLGYKDEENKYYSDDFGYLNKKQLDCKVKYWNHDLGDYNYLEVSVILENEKDFKLFEEYNEEEDE